MVGNPADPAALVVHAADAPVSVWWASSRRFDASGELGPCLGGAYFSVQAGALVQRPLTDFSFRPDGTKLTPPFIVAAR